jgi:hypothetical protein
MTKNIHKGIQVNRSMNSTQTCNYIIWNLFIKLQTFTETFFSNNLWELKSLDEFPYLPKVLRVHSFLVKTMNQLDASAVAFLTSLKA